MESALKCKEEKKDEGDEEDVVLLTCWRDKETAGVSCRHNKERA